MVEQPVNQQGKTTNVIMHNPAADVIEYQTEVDFPEEIRQVDPIGVFLINKTAIGNLNDLEIMILQTGQSMIDLVEDIAGSNVAWKLAKSQRYYFELLRAKNMAERTAQVTQRTMEELRTVSSQEAKRGMFGFLHRKPKQEQPFQSSKGG